MSENQVAFLVGLFEKLSNKLDVLQSDVSDMKVAMATRQAQIDQLLEDRRFFKGKVASLIVALTTILSCLGAYLANKLGITAP